MKPIVNYISAYDNFKVGSSAFVYVLNHPRKTKPHEVITSVIIKVDEDGNGFETLNTIYKRATTNPDGSMWDGMS